VPSISLDAPIVASVSAPSFPVHAPVNANSTAIA